MAFYQYSSAADAPALDAIVITPSASPLPRTVRAIFVGGAGDVTVTTWSGTSVTFTLPAGALPASAHGVGAHTSRTTPRSGTR